MTYLNAEAVSQSPLSSQHVSSDFMALASHMDACQRSRGRFFGVCSLLETLHAFTAPRLVTTGAVILVSGVGLVGLALLTLA